MPQIGKLCATPFGIDVVGITELIALVGALVGGVAARRRKEEVERLNEQLRSINFNLRQQARSGTVYAPGAGGGGRQGGGEGRAGGRGTTSWVTQDVGDTQGGGIHTGCRGRSVPDRSATAGEPQQGELWRGGAEVAGCVGSSLQAVVQGRLVLWRRRAP